VSARRRWLVIRIVVLALLAVVFCAIAFKPAPARSTVVLHVHGKQYTLRVARTATQQEQGLGDRATLARDQGMLFQFQRPAIECFWMKDMHFPLDMIWLSSTKRVAYIQADVSPKTYPKQFCPKVQAQYVIELNAGQAKRAGIRPHQMLTF
jgi:uncharacterized membrane protein (UPF0127 family)